MKVRISKYAAALLLAAAIPAQSAVNRHGQADPDRTPTTLPVPTGIKWLATLDEGYKEAAKYQRPMLVIYGAQWCGPCRELTKELEKPEIHDKLAGWTLVHLDVDKPEPGALAYSGPIPSLRLLSSQGKPLASREGYVAGAELLKWMQDNVPAVIPVDPDLVGDAAPDAAALGRLLTRLGSSDAAARESAANRLAPWPAAVAPAVAEAFAMGNLRTRLATIELLHEWKAPVDGIDPWQPETIDAARIAAIRKWAGSIKPATTQPADLDPDNRQAAELDLARLLATTDPAEAGVIASRLARLGVRLRPTVVDKEKQASSDRQRERLTALRYKLVATAALSQQWPGGLDRLAATDSQTRHVAAEELAARATADEMPLLLELFSDQDPLVREISLSALQKVGGKEGTAALVKLLHDPIANVRAAVLKQLAEQPTAEIADAVIAYLGGEKDNDLVVHAVRVLKASATPNATKSLIGLLSHDSWRVRAEAIDALADMAQGTNGSPDPQVAEAVVKRLDDPDSFVVGRALAAMKPLGRGMSEKALGDLAVKRPELAGEILKTVMADLGRGGNAPNVGVIRGMCSSTNPAIRAAAIVALAGVAQIDCEKEVTAALHDKVDSVRLAGGKALFEVADGMLPKNGFITKPSFFGFGGGQTQVDPAAWVTDFRAGKGRPPWIDKCLPDLEAMLKSPDKAMQLSAALPLVSFGHDAEALPILLDAAKHDAGNKAPAGGITIGDADSKATISGALPWLPWEKRAELFKALTATAPDDRLLEELTTNLTLLRDVRAADLLWKQLDGDRSAQAAEAIFRGLQTVYFNTNNENFSGEAPPADLLKPAKDAAQQQFKSGTEWQKTVALGLLLMQAKDDAKVESKKLYDEEMNSPSLRAKAFQFYLLAAETADAQKFAVDSLGSGKLPLRLQQIALTYLVRGGRDLMMFENGFWVGYSSSSDYETYGSGQIRQIKVPAGLTAESLLPFLKSDDHQIAAYAGYLLCLLQKPEGLPPLLRYWTDQKEERGYDNHNELVYTAITALDDDSQTPVLEKIYDATAKDRYNLREFYWTIRAMHGPKILALRKKMRDDVGMEQLQ